jgi:hypothetical protein
MEIWRILLFAESEYCREASCCEHSNEPSLSITNVIIVDLLDQRLFLIKDCSVLSYRKAVQKAFQNTLYILNILACIQKIPRSILARTRVIFYFS